MYRRLAHIQLAIFLLFLAGCGSTTTKAPSQPMNNAVSKLVHYEILDPEMADMISLQEAQRKSQLNNEVKDSTVGVLTGNGSLLGGYALSELVGAGYSLGDFLSPSNILLAGLGSTQKREQYEIPALFIEIPKACDTFCAEEKMKTIAVTYGQILYQKIDKPFPVNPTVHISEWGGKYDNYDFYVENDNGEKINLIKLQEPEIFTHQGKTYYGGNPLEIGSSSRFYLGMFAELEDQGINAVIDISRQYPELFVYMPKSSFTQSVDSQNKHYKGCRGNFIIEKGQVHMLYQMFGCYVYASENSIEDGVELYIYN